MMIGGEQLDLSKKQLEIEGILQMLGNAVASLKRQKEIQ